MVGRRIYLIGSLRNLAVIEVAKVLREDGWEVFDDWMSPGPETDDHWKAYEQERGRTYQEALRGAHARDVFEFDKRHLEASDIAILVLPAGRSGHLELGWMLGRKKWGFILLDTDDPERWDIMYQFADGVFTTVTDLRTYLKLHQEVQSLVSVPAPRLVCLTCGGPILKEEDHADCR